MVRSSLFMVLVYFLVLTPNVFADTERPGPENCRHRFCTEARNLAKEMLEMQARQERNWIKSVEASIKKDAAEVKRLAIFAKWYESNLIAMRETLHSMEILVALGHSFK